MKHINYLLILVILNISACKENDSVQLKNKVWVEAQKMGNSFVIQDYETFADYMPPELLNQFRGRQNLIDFLKAQRAKLNMEVKEVKISLPSDTVMENNEIQCTLIQTVILKVKEGILIQKGTIIGVSNDNGVKWHFYSMDNSNIQFFKQLFPNISSRLKIEPMEKPTFIRQ